MPGKSHLAASSVGPRPRLYPAQAGLRPAGRLGFLVADVREVLRGLSAMGARIDRQFDASTGTAVAVDPDGIKLELSERAGGEPASPAAPRGRMPLLPLACSRSST
jgi:catechol 2,3-dioxygenase-like lactoylglutathione lyase family enzyme